MNSNTSVKESTSKYSTEKIEKDDLLEFKPFNPNLNDYYIEIFNRLVSTAIDKLPDQRVRYLSDMIKHFYDIVDPIELEGNKFLSAISILRDLLSQGWRIINDDGFQLAPPKLLRGENKEYLRQQLQNERNAQFDIDSVKKFILRMEKEKKFSGKTVSILSLVGDSSLIANEICNIKNAEDEKGRLNTARNSVQPYIQLVDNSSCTYTGYKLRDIWRYFRYNWSIPYKSTPGRNLFYLVRDASQPNHPVMGIAALGNCVLQLNQRDNYIGWTMETIKKTLKKKTITEHYEEMIKGQQGLKRPVEKIKELESEEEYQLRIKSESEKIIPLLMKFIDNALAEINSEDLLSGDELTKPSEEVIRRLKSVSEKLKDKQLNNKKSSGNVDWRIESISPLYKKKRATEIAKLLEAKRTFTKVLKSEKDDLLVLKKLLSTDKGKAINVALQANRKSKIGSNLMEIIVCGGIPPYNELLSGKLVSLLICSPSVIKEYNNRYSEQVSEIASRMKGEELVRDSRLAFLGTTSLYHMGSSQYNRIKVPIDDEKFLEYKKLGETEGFGSVFFTQDTTRNISKMVQLIDGGRKINNVFGEGTSPRLRLIRSGLSVLGISEKYLKHHTRRIVYGIELASNTREFLNGETEELNYLFPLDGSEEKYTQEIIDYWRKRWLLSRIESVDIIERLKLFNKSSLLLSNYF
ncbi:DUF4338 domain-containing protein [Peribacillus muralis]|uniref:Druantia anti-phage system protein DruA n=1 Tax=Peribacillus muralis TaxID=264697 RepID=UPI001F4DE104|nr:Druantia anti-phage system protein DruA [Peribacillus muralis]MCK1994905.1 DUF4338 domain-containing protein [Peribacillus muralis]MCK2015549.1 DUF4338 domain-containing protein [Peribacillus muralis]